MVFLSWARDDWVGPRLVTYMKHLHEQNKILNIGHMYWQGVRSKITPWYWWGKTPSKYFFDEDWSQDGQEQCNTCICGPTNRSLSMGKPCTDSPIRFTWNNSHNWYFYEYIELYDQTMYFPLHNAGKSTFPLAWPFSLFMGIHTDIKRGGGFSIFAFTILRLIDRADTRSEVLDGKHCC